MTTDTHGTPAPLVTQRLIAGVALLVAIYWTVLHLMGREVVSDSGFGLWTGAWTSDTSQWIADPYSASHILHGILFYGFLYPFRHRLPLDARLLIAAAVEAAWEVLENSPLVIDRYRGATASLDYYGDSILNSTFDLAFAIIGFVLAGRFGWKWMVVFAVTVELLMLYFVRDNLTLNILMLIHPFEAIKQWQTAIH